MREIDDCGWLKSKSVLVSDMVSLIDDHIRCGRVQNDFVICYTI
jgi:hypothetical protein